MGKLLLMTGLSGFLGSALAADFLSKEDCRIVYLSMAERDEEKASRRINEILELNHIELDLKERLHTVVCKNGYTSSGLLLKKYHFDEVWHIGAHMSYSMQDFRDVIYHNAVESCNLMRTVSGCGNFYYISTTGSAGIQNGGSDTYVLEEEPLYCFDPTNPYTISKVMAEHMLWNLSQQSGCRLTILRPGSMIGSSENGWAVNTRAGYYSYLYILKKFLNKNIVFYLDINPDSRFPVIHINHLVDICGILRTRTGQDREIYNICNRNLLTVREHFEIFEKVCGNRIRIDYGRGLQSFNKYFNKINFDNNRFMEVNYKFADRLLSKAIGEDNLPPMLTEEGIARVMDYYLNK